MKSSASELGLTRPFHGTATSGDQLVNLLHLLYQYNIWPSCADSPIRLYVEIPKNFCILAFFYLLWFMFIPLVSCWNAISPARLPVDQCRNRCDACFCTVFVPAYCIRRPHVAQSPPRFHTCGILHPWSAPLSLPYMHSLVETDPGLPG